MSSGSNNNDGDEVAKAQAAGAGAADTGAPTIFDKILSGEWSSDKVFEDDRVLAFRDVNPQAPVHILVIPKYRNGLTALSKAQANQKELLGHLMYVATEIANKECPNGFRIIINDGVDGAQSVMHLHLHIMGGRQMGWPPG
jgi:histidine triad (HIT) family protein